MVLKMPHPTPHPKSGIYRCRVAVPKHLRAIIERDHGQRSELHENLGTRDKAQAIRLSRPVFEKFDKWLRAAEAEHTGRATVLSDREISSLCGQWLAQQEEANRHHLVGTAESHLEDAEWFGDILSGSQDADQANAEAIAALTAGLGVSIGADSRHRLAERLSYVRWEWHRDMARRLGTGQWNPKIRSADFPSPATSGRVVTFDSILDAWGADHGLRRDAKPQQRAFYDRLRTIERLADFLGHRDASQVTKGDAVRWKEDMQKRNLAVATIRNDLSEMSAIWRHAIRNEKVPGSNPFEGVSPPKARRRGREVRPFTDEEARRVLEAARGQTGALRWLPWVCAFTGARLNEVTQSHREDVATVSGVLCLRIHDEGEDGSRSLKNEDSRRSVPIHPTLRAEGFIEYVNGLSPGSPLFPDLKADAFGRRASMAGKKVGRWLRSQGITDERISPNHSWRHSFVDWCRATLMPSEVRSAITGHSGRVDESAGYGGGMKSLIQVMGEQMERVKGPFGALLDADTPAGGTG